MQTIESLRQKIKNAEALLSVVKTMKSLAAVNIRQYERAVAALAEYNRAVEMGLHIMLSAQDTKTVTTQPMADNRLGVIAFGSDQGLCGQFNENIVAFALGALHTVASFALQPTWIAVGSRPALLLEDAGQPVPDTLTTPVSSVDITNLVQALLLRIDEWRVHRQIDQVLLFHNHPLGGAAYSPCRVQLLPVDRDWLHSLEESRWPSRVLPIYTMNWDSLFAALIRQYMFVALYRACAESLAAENASRLASMQNAQGNIEDRLTELNRNYHYQRQNTVTNELLDIFAGFEALSDTAP